MQTTETLVSDEAIQAISESDESADVGGLYVTTSDSVCVDRLK